jgi:hypothetical protein
MNISKQKPPGTMSNVEENAIPPDVKEDKE